MRTRSERRHNDWKHINRKLFIVRNTWCSVDETWSNMREPHRWSKQKVHCSCMMCSAKTRRDGYDMKTRRAIDKVMSSYSEIEN